MSFGPASLPERRLVALIVGTRPEAIKLAPVHRALACSRALRPVLISTGQHRELLRDALASLELQADHDLDVMVPEQSPNDVALQIFRGMPELLRRLGPSAIVVQGDTTTVLAVSLVAFHLGIPVAHVEAGLRTYRPDSPFPEEMNRQLTDRLATWCFAPTESAANNLAAERIAAERVRVTGNTIVDSLHWALPRSKPVCDRPTLLVTLHRRESFGAALEAILWGVRDFVEATPEASVLWPVHPNPVVLEAGARIFADHPNLKRVSPLGYVEMIGALCSCRVILTDSGGIQEEAPSLGKTVLVARDATERLEGLAGPRCRLVGRSSAGISSALAAAWIEPAHGGPLPLVNPYGDGRAAERIVEALEQSLALR